VKLHGNLRDGIIRACFQTFRTAPECARSVQRYINQDIIIAGSIARDNDVTSADRIWRGQHLLVHPYVTETDGVIRLIEERGGIPEVCVIDRQYGILMYFSNIGLSCRLYPPGSMDKTTDFHLERNNKILYNRLPSLIIWHNRKRRLPGLISLLLRLMKLKRGRFLINFRRHVEIPMRDVYWR